MIPIVRVYAVIGIKGGVGKSLISIALAREMSKYYNVGLVDCDIDSSNIPGMMKLDKGMKLSKDGVRFIPVWISDTLKMVSLESLGMGRKKAAVTKEGKQHQQIIRDMIQNTVWGKTEVLIADMPAGSSDEFLGVMSIFDHIDGCIAVAQPSTAEDFYRVIDLCKYHGIRLLGAVENMNGTMTECCVSAVCPVCQKEFNPLGKDVIRGICNKEGIPYWGSIPLLSDKIDFNELHPAIQMPIARIVYNIRGVETV